jgi:hypothetical protein
MTGVRRAVSATVVTMSVLTISGCAFGEQQVIEGYIDNAYDNRAVAHVVVGERGERDGWPVVDLMIKDFEILGEPALSLEVGDVYTVRTGGLDVDEGVDLVVFLDSRPAIAYAMDPGTDLPVHGFDKATSGGSQEAALDCLADVFGTTGAHRREAALLMDVKLAPERRHYECTAPAEG